MAEKPESASTANPNLLGHFPLKGKIAVVTGGGSGINLAFCTQIQAAGCSVLIADLQLTDAAQALIDDSAARAARVVFTRCDVASWADLRALVPAAVALLGDIPDIYVGGAGVFDPPWSNFWDDSEDAAGRYAALDINLAHPVKLTRLAMRALVGRRRRGVVLHVASAGGLAGVYAQALYCTSKAGLVGFVRAMQPAERLEGVKVCCVCPGIVDTPLWDAAKRARMPLDRVPTVSADDVAAAMVELVVDGETYRGGAVLEVSPGEERRRLVPALGPSTRESRAGSFFEAVQMEQASAECPALFEETRRVLDAERAAPWP